MWQKVKDKVCRTSSTIVGYFVALAVSAVAAAAHWALVPLTDSRTPYLFFTASTAYVAATWGIGPALLVVAIGGLNAALILPPVGSLYIQDLGNLWGIAAYVAIASAFAYVFDSSRRKELLYRQTIERSEKKKDLFVTQVAHELRNALSPMESGTDLLLLKGSGADVPEVARIMKRQVETMRTLTDDLLDLSRLSNQKLILHLGSHLLSKIVAEAVEAAGPATETRTHTVELALPQPDVLITCDERRMRQILVNLLVNAAKYTPRGGTIRLAAKVDYPRLVLEVSDNGIGIAETDLTRLFDDFYQVSNGQQRDSGLGIGLALVKGLVQLHGEKCRLKARASEREARSR